MNDDRSNRLVFWRNGARKRGAAHRPGAGGCVDAAPNDLGNPYLALRLCGG